MVVEKFQIYGVRITREYICESKNWICSFLLMPLSKNLPQVLIITTQAEGNYPFSLNSVSSKSVFPSVERGKDYGAEWLKENQTCEGIGNKLW